MWIWPATQCADFQFDAQVLQPAIAAARVAQGRMPGMASQLQLVDLSQLQIGAITAEAVATAQIEDEILHAQSVRLWAAARAGRAWQKPLLARSPQCAPGHHRLAAEIAEQIVESGTASWRLRGRLAHRKICRDHGRVARDGVAATDAAC